MSISYKIQAVQGEFAEAAAAETVAEAPLALDLEPTDNTDVTNFLFSENAEDNGIAGTLDLADGLIYDGPPDNYVQVSVQELDISEGTIAPGATDEVVGAIYINSTHFDNMNTEDARRLGAKVAKVASTEETLGSGFVSEIDTGIVVEFHYEGMVGPLLEGDVIRFCLLGGGEGTIDWDVPVEFGTWSIS